MWTKVKGYEDFIEVTRDGKVRSIPRICSSGKTVKGKELAYTNHRNGYIEYRVSMNGTAKMFKAHQLVAMTFLERPEGATVVNHKNGIKHDNRVENLEWCTYQHNTKEAIRMGLFPINEDSWKAKLSNEQALSIYKSDKPTIELASLYGVSESTVHQIRNGLTWKNITSNVAVDDVPQRLKKEGTDLPRGVYVYNKSSDKYRSSITHNKEAHHLGIFDCPIEARKAYEEAYLRLKGKLPR